MQDPPSSSLNAYSPPPNGNQMQSSQQSQPQMQRSQQSLYGQYPMMNYLGSPYLSQQQHSPTQGTLSPFALHSPSSMSIPTNQFYGTNLTPPSSSSTPAPAPPSVQSPEQTRKDQFLTSLKAALQPKEFSGARGVQHLVMLITEYGVQDVDAETRRDILTKIRDNAGNHFFRAWLENSGAMEVTREWLKAGATGTEDNQMLETIMPLLHVSSIRVLSTRSSVLCPTTLRLPSRCASVARRLLRRAIPCWRQSVPTACHSCPLLTRNAHDTFLNANAIMNARLCAVAPRLNHPVSYNPQK